MSTLLQIRPMGAKGCGTTKRLNSFTEGGHREHALQFRSRMTQALRDNGEVQLLVGGLVNILGPHPFEDVAEQFELPEGLFVGLRRNRGSGNGRQHRRECKRGDQFTH